MLGSGARAIAGETALQVRPHVREECAMMAQMQLQLLLGDPVLSPSASRPIRRLQPFRKFWSRFSARGQYASFTGSASRPFRKFIFSPRPGPPALHPPTPVPNAIPPPIPFSYLSSQLFASRTRSSIFASCLHTISVCRSGRSFRSVPSRPVPQLQVYRPLLERADSIDRSRLAAEEALRAATAELEREREASAAAKRDAAELRLALERRGSRLAEAEAEVGG